MATVGHSHKCLVPDLANKHVRQPSLPWDKATWAAMGKSGTMPGLGIPLVAFVAMPSGPGAVHIALP